MKISNYIRVMALLMGLGLTSLPARDIGAYQVGDVVGADIVAPMTFDVVDPVATAALRADEGAKTPAFFRGYSGVTNGLVEQFDAAFQGARSNFVSSIQETFHQATLDEATVTSADFGYLVTAFNIKNKNFPVSSALAMEWAYGKNGEFQKSKLLAGLLEAMQFRIRPDGLPAGYGAAESWQIVPVESAQEKLSLADAATRGQTVSKADVLSLSQACIRFRRAFTSYDEQPLARALAGWLKPNCFPDTELTQVARDRAIGQLVVTEHYLTGQVIAAKGSVIDSKDVAALKRLQELLAYETPAPVAAAKEIATTQEATIANDNKAITAVADSTVGEATAQQPEPVPVVQAYKPVAQPVVQPVKVVAPHHAAVIELTGVSIISGVIFVAALVWRLFFLKNNDKSLARTNDPLAPAPTALAMELTPRLVQVVREALVQELADQRRELLIVQQSAAVEVSRLVRRMDEMQMALNQRLLVYEQQIQRLEAELAARTEENHELIKMKIEMIREQSQSERDGEPVGFN